MVLVEYQIISYIYAGVSCGIKNLALMMVLVEYQIISYIYKCRRRLWYKELGMSDGFS